MDIKKKREVKNGQGNAASMDNGDFVSRSSSWQMGANVVSDDIDAEGQEEDRKWGVPSSIADGDGMAGDTGSAVK